MLERGDLGLLFFLTLYLQNILGFSPLKTGISLLPLTAMVLVVSPLAGRLTTTLGPRCLVSFGILCAAVGVAILYFTPIHSSAANWRLIVPAFLCIGAGLGFANPPIVAVATGTVEHERAGLAAGLNTVCRQLGTAVGVALIGAFVTVSYHRALASRVPHDLAWMTGFHAGVVVSAAVLLAGALVAFSFVREARPAP